MTFLGWYIHRNRPEARSSTYWLLIYPDWRLNQFTWLMGLSVSGRIQFIKGCPPWRSILAYQSSHFDITFIWNDHTSSLPIRGGLTTDYRPERPHKVRNKFLAGVAVWRLYPKSSPLVAMFSAKSFDKPLVLVTLVGRTLFIRQGLRTQNYRWKW